MVFVHTNLSLSCGEATSQAFYIILTPIFLKLRGTEPKKEEPDKKNTEDVEVKFVPEGTFAGTIEKPILVKDGEPIPENTGDQGGGQD